MAGGIAFLLGDDIVSPAVQIDCKPKRVAMVIDDTGSMGGVIGSVRSTLASYISSTPEDEYTSWRLTTFKDSPNFRGITEDKTEALGLVSGLTASGGGDCPEDVLGGIVSGLGVLGADPDVSKQMSEAGRAAAAFTRLRSARRTRPATQRLRAPTSSYPRARARLPSLRRDIREAP